MIQIYRAVIFQYESKTLRSNGSIRGAAHHVSIPDINTGKNQSDCAYFLKCLRIVGISYRDFIS